MANAVFRNAEAIKEAKKILSPNTMEAVKDASMGKILKQIGATTDEGGTVVLNSDFVEAFQSGD